MISKIFLEHPRSIGETYGEHFKVASQFSVSLLLAGLACAIHALIPALCKTTASRAVAQLHYRMVTHRAPQGEPLVGQMR